MWVCVYVYVCVCVWVCVCVCVCACVSVCVCDSDSNAALCTALGLNDLRFLQKKLKTFHTREKKAKRGMCTPYLVSFIFAFFFVILGCLFVSFLFSFCSSLSTLAIILYLFTYLPIYFYVRCVSFIYYLFCYS